MKSCLWAFISRHLPGLLFCALLSNVGQAQSLTQNRFVAIPPQEMARYHIDFARHFFASAEVEKAARAELYETLKTLESFKGKVAQSAENLKRALRLNDQLRIQFIRHYSYLYLRNAVDTLDEQSLAESSALDAE